MPTLKPPGPAQPGSRNGVISASVEHVIDAAVLGGRVPVRPM